MRSTSRVAAFVTSHRPSRPFAFRPHVSPRGLFDLASLLPSLSLPLLFSLSAALAASLRLSLSLSLRSRLSSLLVPSSRAACAIAFTHLAQPPRVSQTSKRMTSTIGYAYIASLLALSPCLHHLLDHVLVIPRFSRTTCLLDSDARHRSSPFLPLSLFALDPRAPRAIRACSIHACTPLQLSLSPSLSSRTTCLLDSLTPSPPPSLSLSSCRGELGCSEKKMAGEGGSPY